MKAELGRDYVWLRPVDARVDAEVQRRFDQTHANRIAKSYDPALFGLGHVSLRADGTYVVLDGQHRVSAAKSSGHGEVKVLFRVYRGLSAATEADKFLELNANKKSVNALDGFNLALKAGHPVNVEIARILKSFGLRVAGYRTDGGVSAVVALIHIYNGRVNVKPSSDSSTLDAAGLPEAQLLSRTLSVLVKAYGTDRDAFDGILLKGIAGLLVKHGAKVDSSVLSKALKKSPPVVALSNIRGFASTGRMSITVAAVTYLENVYNYGRSDSKRLVP
jgi:hypothetical protein